MLLHHHSIRRPVGVIFFVTAFVLLLAAQPALAQTTVTVTDLTYSGQVIPTGSSPIPMFSAEVTTANPYETYVEGLEIVIHAGALPCDVEPTDISAVALYVDNGDGIFSSADDGPVIKQVSGGDLEDDENCNYLAAFESFQIPVPNTIFVAVTTSDSPSTGDDFTAEIQQGTMVIVGYVGGSPTIEPGPFPSVSEETYLLTIVKSPKATLSVAALVGNGQGILPRSGPTEIFGIDANVVGASQRLSQIWVRVEDEGEVPVDGLDEITASDFMVLQVYRDTASTDPLQNGVFNPPGGEQSPDFLIGEVAISDMYLNPEQMYTPFYLFIGLNESDWIWPAYLPLDNASSNAGNDFFVVIRTSDTIDSDFNGYNYNPVDDFKFVIEPFSLSVIGTGGSLQHFPAIDQPEIETSVITTEALAISLWPYAMDRTDYLTEYTSPPGASFDKPDGSNRYDYEVPAQSLRMRYLGERDREFTGMGENTYEGFHGPFEQPVIGRLERRQTVIGLDVAGGTANDPEGLTSLTLTLSNVGSDFVSLHEFNPDFALDPLRGSSVSSHRDPFFSGIAVYQDSNNDGKYTEPTLDPETHQFDPYTGDQPLDFSVSLSPLLPRSAYYNHNLDESVYAVRLCFCPGEAAIEVNADHKPDFFIVIRPDSGWYDDYLQWGDGTAVNFGADFKISLERAEDLDFDGVADLPDFNSDGIPQTPPVAFRRADPRDGLTILTDNSADPSFFRQVHEIDAVVDVQDLCLDFGTDLPENDSSKTIQQRIDAASMPTALLAINAASSEVPQLNLIDEPLTLTEVRLNFSGDGFEPTDIDSILLVRDDKSPFVSEGRSVGAYDIFNDLWNLPPPDGVFGDATNPDEDSPVAVTPWTWQNEGGQNYAVLMPEIPPRIYPHDDIESDASIDVFTDNFEQIQSPYSPGLLIPRDSVYAGADYFVAVMASDTISYDDEIKIEVPLGGLALSNGMTTVRSVDLWNPEWPDSEIVSIRANVPVILHDLVSPEQMLDASSAHTPVIGLNMYTNRPTAALGGVDVYFEQIIVAFLQYGTRDSFNIASDLRPFENVNQANTVNSGIQLYRDANGNGRFDGAAVETLVPMDSTPLLGPNPSRIGLAGEEANQVLMVFSSAANRQLIPATDIGANAGDDFFLVIRTSANFDATSDNFSVAIISWGPDSPAAPAPHTINANQFRPYEAISSRQAYPFTRRGIGFVDSDGIRTRSTESINTNVFNATNATLLSAVEEFNSTACDEQISNPTRQALLTWVDTNHDNPDTPYISENESGYWIEADIYGEFMPLAQNPLPADSTSLFFDGPALLTGKTITFRIYAFRTNIDGNPLDPPYNGPGPSATTSVTFATSVLAVPPTANFGSNPAGTACVGQTVQFTDLSLCEPASWTWEFGDGATSSLQNPSHVYAAAGSYTVSLTVTNDGGADSITRTGYITVSPIVADFSGTPLTGSAPLNVQFNDLSMCSPTSWLWEFGDGETSTQQNPAHSYTDAGTYTVTLTVTNAGGSDSLTMMDYVTVTSPPHADFDSVPSGNVCVGVTVQFNDLSTSGPISWSWDFGDGYTSSSQNPSHSYAGQGDYTVCLRVSNDAGSDTMCKPITVSQIVADFSADVTSGCEPLIVQFSDLSQCGPTSWLWNFGDGQTSTEPSPQHTYSNWGTYTVSLTVTSAVGSDTKTETSYIQVSATPVADFTAAPSAGQAPLQVTFTDTSTGLPTTWEWDFGDGSPVSNSQNVIHTFENAGTYPVCLTTTNVCGNDTKCADITAQAAPMIGLSATSLDNAAMHGTNALAQTFEVWNSGEATLSYTVSETVYWLALNPTSGSSTGEHDTITVNYTTATMAPGNYNTTITVSASGVANNPQEINVSLRIAESYLTEIDLASPWKGLTLTSPPTFAWTATGGVNNVFSVEMSYSANFSAYWSTYKDLHQTLTDTNWTMPTSTWDQITPGRRVYWRVRGRDMSRTPARIITSGQTWWFMK